MESRTSRQTMWKTKILHCEIRRSHFQKKSLCTWNPGQVVRQCEEPRSYIVKSGDRTFRRNRRDLLWTKERSFPDHAQSREKEDIAVFVSPVQDNSKSFTFTEKAPQPVIVSESEYVKVSEKSCENKQYVNVYVKMPERKSVNCDVFRSGIRFTRSGRASVLPAQYQT